LRVLILDTCYEAFLAAHYARHPALEEQPYDIQWRALMGTFFGTADSYSHFLAPVGVDAHEVVVNCEPLQRAWSREHGAEHDSGEETFLRQVNELEPDVVYVQNLNAPSDEALRQLRARGVFVAGQIASEAPAADRLRMFDLILTSFPHFVERFEDVGVPSAYFRIGFDPRVLDALDATPASQHEIVFVGALNGIRHRRGNKALARAARSLPVQFWGYDTRGWPPWSPIRRRYRGEAWGIDMYRVLHGSRVVLNRHIGAAGPYANNMRLYEATGVGALLLTDEKVNLAELFEPGREVVTYRTAEDLAERARHYLEHEDERRAVAAAGQARTLRDHTYAERMKELVGILEAHR
jgi:hypothetical protein